MKKNYLRFGILLSLITTVLLLVSTVIAAPDNTLVVSLAASQSKYKATEDVMISVTISNPTNHSLRILKWFTPVNGLEEPVFSVKVDGESAFYTGAVYKRPPATGNDYISIKAGESVTFSVNLGDYYNLTRNGQYEIFFDAASYYLFTEKGNSFSNPDSLISEPISIKVDGRAPKGKPTPPPPPDPGGTAFNACTVDQQALLLSARSEAKTYASGAENYLIAGTQGSRYLTWFGVFNTSRYDTATSHFTSISNAWDNAGVTFDCKCKQNYYAYVYPNDPYKIYLCRVFWQAPLTGTDSRAGTLIHEMSHFYVVADTDDFVYGQTGAKSLAITNPDNAVMNADNHEYFAENTPALP